MANCGWRTAARTSPSRHAPSAIRTEGREEGRHPPPHGARAGEGVLPPHRALRPQPRPVRDRPERQHQHLWHPARGGAGDPRGGGVDPSCVVTGEGSDDVLDSAIRAFAEPGEAVAYPDPSFAMIPIFARMNGLEPVGVPMAGARGAPPEVHDRAADSESHHRLPAGSGDRSRPPSTRASPDIDPDALLATKARIIY